MSSIESLEKLYAGGSKREALNGLKKIADGDVPEAMVVYASLLDDYADGDRVYGEEIVKYFEMAMKAGEVDALYHLGSIFREGSYVDENIGKAKKYYRMGAGLGDFSCMEELADLILSERSPDYSEAFSLYYSAINGGVPCYGKCMTTIVKGNLSGDSVREFKKKLLVQLSKPLAFAIGMIFLVAFCISIIL